MSLEAVHSAADVAHALGVTERYVADCCRARKWPHIKKARRQVAFTDEHYEQILKLLEVEAQEPQQSGLSWAPRSKRGAA